MRDFLHFIYYCLRNKISWLELLNISAESTISKKSKFIGSYYVYNASIGDYTYISKNANISFSSIGKFCSIGPNFICGWGIHPTNGISTSPMFYSKDKTNGFSVSNNNKIETRERIVIGNDVFIGANVIVLDGVKIGDGAVVGAGAVVTKDIPPYAIVVGCPAQIIKYRFDEVIINKLLKIEWWNQSENIFNDIEKCFFDVELFLNKYYVD